MKGWKQVQDKDKGKARGMTIKKTGKKERAYRTKYNEISRQNEQCGQVCVVRNKTENKTENYRQQYNES